MRKSLIHVRTPKSAINVLYGQNSRITKKSRSSVSRESVLIKVADQTSGHIFENNMKRSFVEPNRILPRKLVPAASDEAQMYLQLLKLANIK